MSYDRAAAKLTAEISDGKAEVAKIATEVRTRGQKFYAFIERHGWIILGALAGLAVIAYVIVHSVHLAK
jgi:hypothetical protein